MEKPVAAVEFGSKKLKLVVGYELNGQVYVLYALTRPYGIALEGGEFLDTSKVIEAVKDSHEFSDQVAKIKFSIGETLLALPAIDLEIYQSKQMTAVIGEESKVTNLDIRNVYTIIRTGANNISNQIVDVVPEYFYLDQQRRYTTAPLGLVSSSICIDAKIHTLPKKVISEYENALVSGGINVKRTFVTPYAASELIATDPEMPENYLLVDIGSSLTTVSLIGKKQLYGSISFNWGGDKITDKIIECFNINEMEAEKYKITYGIDYRQMNFKAPVCTTSDDFGNYIKHYSDELNHIIENELNVFVKHLSDALDSLLNDYPSTYRQFPMVLIGGGSRLNGLTEYMNDKVLSDKIIVWTPKSLGARNPTFTNCLGMILANAKNPSVYDESHPRVGNLTRDEKK